MKWITKKECFELFNNDPEKINTLVLQYIGNYRDMYNEVICILPINLVVQYAKFLFKTDFTKVTELIKDKDGQDFIFFIFLLLGLHSAMNKVVIDNIADKVELKEKSHE